MKCVIIKEQSLVDLGKRCLSNLRDHVEDEYFLRHKEVKRLRILYFLACQRVWFGGKLPGKELEKKFWEAEKYIRQSEVGNEDETEVEEVFNTTVTDFHTKVNFSLEQMEKIFSLINTGLERCKELFEDLYYEIKDFQRIYEVYELCYKSLV